MGKDQHYVPVFLLKNFSTDTEGNFFNIHLLNADKFILPGKIEGQAQKNYLYGSDQKLEKFFGMLENETAPIIMKLASKKFELTNEEKLHLKLFIMYQMNRTPGNVELLNNSIESIIKNAASHDNFLKEKLNEFSLGINNPYMFLFIMATKAIHVMMDLRIGLLESNPNNPFIIGQNPVIRLNPFLQTKGWKFSTQGLILKGAMIIMPISPQFSVILYDSYRYTLVNKKPEWVINDADINLLNRLQYLNTDECVYFMHNPDINCYNQISHETQLFRNDFKAKIEILKKTVNKNENMEALVNSGIKEYPIQQQFNFCALKNDAYLEIINTHFEAKRNVMPNFIQDEIDRRIGEKYSK